MLHPAHPAVTQPDAARALMAMALFGALAVTFEGVHGVADQWGQTSVDAINKGRYGTEMVLRDGSPAMAEDIADPAVRTMSAKALGRLSAARHVLAYGAIQTVATVAVTRALGHRVKPSALAVGAVINLGTHLVIDRRRPLMRLAAVAGKGEYLRRCTVVRAHDREPEPSGPGTGLFELDQALHRGIGVVAAAVTTVLAVRGRCESVPEFG